MMEIKELKRLKEEYKITNELLAEISGVPYSTITKIFCGVTKNPRADKLRAIEDAIIDFCKDESDAGNIAVLFRGKAKTIDDWMNLPDDVRAELIDGVLYYMNNPSLWHQRVIGLVHYQLMSYIREKNGTCLPLMAPFGVQIDMDDDTVVQPDVMVVCDQSIIREYTVFGAPDFVMEVVSPSSKKRDYFIKLNKYQNAGVKEYWIVDRSKKHATVYTHLDDPEEMQLDVYPLNEKIPVGLYEDLYIDISELMEDE